MRADHDDASTSGNRVWCVRCGPSEAILCDDRDRTRDVFQNVSSVKCVYRCECTGFCAMRGQQSRALGHREAFSPDAGN
jgi:hypothetical protein